LYFVRGLDTPKPEPKVAEEGGVKAGLLINATRVAIVGQAVAPPLFDTMVALGQERVVRRN
jgi:glutamyl-tRNA synthetase